MEHSSTSAGWAHTPDSFSRIQYYCTVWQRGCLSFFLSFHFFFDSLPDVFPNQRVPEFGPMLRLRLLLPTLTPPSSSLPPPLDEVRPLKGLGSSFAAGASATSAGSTRRGKATRGVFVIRGVLLGVGPALSRSCTWDVTSTVGSFNGKVSAGAPAGRATCGSGVALSSLWRGV